ncbi:benzoate 4-monooxygenase cytochrome p450 [Apiospora kogelbergensis]|uniref:benzoate 4-monooxygenase cytochrome p450 n=1 Tax=Apiospora kogelbergensis TaxID=1337665 RepID=UPI0031314B43
MEAIQPIISDPRSALVALVAVSGLTTAVWWTISYLTSPLRQYPGPFLAGWTNWWRFFLVRTGSYHIGIKKLHDEYGPVVRIGPNTLDIDYPELSKTFYGTDGKWKKTEFYHNNSAVVNGKITYHLFSETDQANHARMKRPIVHYYSASSVAALEPLMDKVIGDFCGHLETRFMGKTSKSFDLGEWIAFSGQIPFLDFLLDKNPVMRIGPPNLGNVTRISLEHLIARLQGKDANFDPEVPDFLQHFVDTKKTSPDLVDDGIIMGYLLVNLLAGADTTAITLRAIFYYALREPRAYRKLEDEILAADLGGAVPRYGACRKLPYLEAVVREASRLHPGVCMLLERYRWLRGEEESEEEYRRRLRRFNAADLTFGGGSHVCIGRNLALLETYKVVATIVRRYHVELEDPAREWKVTGSWFTRQKGGLDCRLRLRCGQTPANGRDGVAHRDS